MRTTLESRKENMPLEFCGAKSVHPGLCKKSGSVCMSQSLQGRTVKLKVGLSVYTSNYDRYAVVQPERSSVVAKNSAFINLKNCAVVKLENADNTFQIIPRNCEGNVLTFTTANLSELSDWLSVFQTSSTENVLKSPLRRPLGGLRPFNGRQPLASSKKQPIAVAPIPLAPALETLEEEEGSSEGSDSSGNEE